MQCSPSSSGCTHLSSAARAASLLNLRAAAIVCSELRDNRIVGTLEPLASLRRLRYLYALPIDTMVELVCSRCREELCSDSVWLRPCEDVRSMRICVQRRQPEWHQRRTRSTLRTYDARANVPNAWGLPIPACFRRYAMIRCLQKDCTEPNRGHARPHRVAALVGIPGQVSIRPMPKPALANALLRLLSVCRRFRAAASSSATCLKAKLRRMWLKSFWITSASPDARRHVRCVGCTHPS